MTISSFSPVRFGAAPNMPRASQTRPALRFGHDDPHHDTPKPDGAPQAHGTHDHDHGHDHGHDHVHGPNCNHDHAPPKTAPAAPATAPAHGPDDTGHVHGPGCGHHHDEVPPVAGAPASESAPLTQRVRNFFALPTSPNGNWKGNAWVSGMAGAVLGSLVLPGPGTVLGVLIGWAISFMFAPSTPTPSENGDSAASPETPPAPAPETPSPEAKA